VEACRFLVYGPVEVSCSNSLNGELVKYVQLLGNVRDLSIQLGIIMRITFEKCKLALNGIVGMSEHRYKTNLFKFYITYGYRL
jgi:hypothetical protein